MREQARDRLTREVAVWGTALAGVVVILGAVWGMTVFVVSLFAALLAALLVAHAAMREAEKAAMYCPHCGMTGVPQTVSKGSNATELVLWFVFLLPGLIYSIWRRNSRHEACPSCRQAGMIPADSPRALELKRKITMPE